MTSKADLPLNNSIRSISVVTSPKQISPRRHLTFLRVRLRPDPHSAVDDDADTLHRQDTRDCAPIPEVLAGAVRASRVSSNCQPDWFQVLEFVAEHSPICRRLSDWRLQPSRSAIRPSSVRCSSLPRSKQTAYMRRGRF